MVGFVTFSFAHRENLSRSHIREYDFDPNRQVIGRALLNS
jgi:hypothetical protein